MYQRILVATDGSKLSKKAVSTAIELAQVCGAELVAVKVCRATLATEGVCPSAVKWQR
jgi:nucleotide-binding universal stress UspA family protein